MDVVIVEMGTRVVGCLQKFRNKCTKSGLPAARRFAFTFLSDATRDTQPGVSATGKALRYYFTSRTTAGNPRGDEVLVPLYFARSFQMELNGASMFSKRLNRIFNPPIIFSHQSVPIFHFRKMQGAGLVRTKGRNIPFEIFFG